MARDTGTVKFFSDVKGFGFILPDDGGQEVFVHKANLLRGLMVLTRGQRVEYHIGTSAKGNGFTALDVKVIS